MKIISRATVLLSILFVAIACKSKPTIDTPIVSNDFHSLLLNIDTVCKNISRVDCEYIWALVQLSMPNVKNSNYILAKTDEIIASDVFSKFNGKTPRELLQIYKSELINQVQLDIEKDRKIISDLDELLTTYNDTKKYKKNFTFNGVKNTFLKNSSNIMWNIYNNSKFNIKQIIGNVEYYDGKKLIFKSQDFTHKFNPDLMSGERLTILVNINIEQTMIKKLKTIKDLRIEINLKSMITTTKNVDTLIFELSDSYHKMRALLKKSEELYKERINLINNIRVE